MGVTLVDDPMVYKSEGEANEQLRLNFPSAPTLNGKAAPLELLIVLVQVLSPILKVGEVPAE